MNRKDQAAGHEQAGDRPCLIISSDRYNSSRAEMCIVVAGTHTAARPDLPTDIPLSKNEGLESTDGCIRADQVRAISRKRLRRKAGRVTGETYKKVIEALNSIIG